MKTKHRRLIEKRGKPNETTVCIDNLFVVFLFTVFSSLCKYQIGHGQFLLSFFFFPTSLISIYYHFVWLVPKIPTESFCLNVMWFFLLLLWLLKRAAIATTPLHTQRVCTISEFCLSINFWIDNQNREDRKKKTHYNKRWNGLCEYGNKN